MAKVIAPNVKYDADGPWPSLMIGERVRHAVELIKLIVAAIGTTLPGMIYGMYIQTVGPIVIP